MKRSIGWAASPEGRAGLVRGFSDHQSSGSVFFREADSGQTAPSPIQRFSVSTSAAVRRSPLGGMRVSRSAVVTNFTSGLSAALPGRMFGAWLSPPCRATSRSSSRNSLFCFFGPWHSTQCFSKIGCTSDSKETAQAFATDRNRVATKSWRVGMRFILFARYWTFHRPQSLGVSSASLGTSAVMAVALLLQ